MSKNNEECTKLFVETEQPGDQNQQMQQLLQAMINTLNQPRGPQVENSEQNLVNISTFTRGNQDLVEWLEAIDRAFEANNIVGARKLSVVGAYLTGLAASWWKNRRNQEPQILTWSNKLAPIQGFVQQFQLNFCTQALITQWNSELLTRRQRPGESVNQYAQDMLVMFQHVARVGNQYPKIMKAQMFVQGLQPDLSLAVRPFMSNTI